MTFCVLTGLKFHAVTHPTAFYMSFLFTVKRLDFDTGDFLMC